MYSRGCWDSIITGSIRTSGPHLILELESVLQQTTRQGGASGGGRAGVLYLWDANAGGNINRHDPLASAPPNHGGEDTNFTDSFVRGMEKK